MRNIIINGDDFGLSRAVNAGIIRAYRHGTLTGASLMVNMPGFNEAADLIRENPGLDIGMHFNFFRGKPVLHRERARTLINKDGVFREDIFKIIAGVYLRRISLTELKEECEAQLKKAIDCGIKISNINSEKNLHLIPAVYRILAKLANVYKIHRIRGVVRGISCRGAGFFNTFMFSLITGKIKEINRLHYIKSADSAFAVFKHGSMSISGYERILSCRETGALEIICHPGESVMDKTADNFDIIRERDLSALLDPKLKELMADSRINLIRNRDL